MVFKKNLFVIRFDNRDVGLSTLFEDMGTPDIMQAALARAKGETIKPYYTFDDMADDIIGLLDTLRIKKAHICGESMGANIAFNVGYRYPSRVISLISIVGSTGNPELPQSKPGALDLWINPEPDDVELAIDNLVNAARNLAGSGFIFEEEWHRTKVRDFMNAPCQSRNMDGTGRNGNLERRVFVCYIFGTMCSAIRENPI